MELGLNEEILRVYRRHKTPYVFLLVRILFLIVPIALILYFLSFVTSGITLVIVGLISLFIVALFVIHASLMYWLDSLTITNKRIVFTNWTSLISREEFEAGLHEIQDIKTKENGFFSRWGMFDYGLFKIETSSSETSIVFYNAPDPEGIKKYLVRHMPAKGSRSSTYHQVMDVMLE